MIQVLCLMKSYEPEISSQFSHLDAKFLSLDIYMPGKRETTLVRRPFQSKTILREVSVYDNK